MASDFRPGSRIGNFVLDAFVGGGSFGNVWRAHADGDDRPFAIKILTGELAEGEYGRMRADVELLAASAASRSEHVVKVVASGTEPAPYIVMEFIDGRDLQSLLREKGRLTSRETLDVALAVADALRALFQVGIIHRDIKPANVLIDAEGVIKLADFGIAKIVGYATVSMTGQTAMTMAYAAPEIWNEDGGFGRPSHRSDLYAMGILLYQCLTGTTPFAGNYGALYHAHTERAPDLRLLPPDTPASLGILISRCLAKSQDERPRDAEACLDLIRRAEVELAEAAGVITTEPRRFGPWIVDRPHESVPWAWRCHQESNAASATVEVYFSNNLDLGDRLSSLVQDNASLVHYGAERLLSSNRLLLFPNEAWQAAPVGQFQFWLAREDLPIMPADVVTEPGLRQQVRVLAGLLDTAERTELRLDFGNGNLTVTESNAVYLRRPGLSEPSPEPESVLFRRLGALPLDDHARRIVNSARDFADLRRSLLADQTEVGTASGDVTVVWRQAPQDSATIVAPAVGSDAMRVVPVGPAIEAAAGKQEPASARGRQPTVRADLKTIKQGTRFGAAKFLLTLHNQGSQETRVRLGCQVDGAVPTLPSAITLAAGVTQDVPISVRPRTRRLLGRTLENQVTVSVTDAVEGGSFTCKASYGDESNFLVVVAGGGFGVLLVVLLAFLITSGGGGSGSGDFAVSAKRHLDAFEPSAALADYNKAIANQPSAANYAGRANAQFDLGDLKDAATDADKAMQLDHANAQAYYVRSMVSYWQEDREQAIATASKAIELSSSNADYYAQRANAYGEQDKDHQLADATKAVSLDSNNANAHDALGAAYASQKRYTDAAAEYQKALTLAPKNGLIYSDLASLSLETNDYAHGIASLDQNSAVIASFPFSEAMDRARGALTVNQDKYPEAVNELNKAIGLVDSVPSFYNWRGYAYYLQQNFGPAVTDLNRAIDLAPSYADAYNTRSLVRRDQKQIDKALEDVNKAISLSPNDATYQSSLAVTLWSRDDYPGTIAAASKAIQLDSASAEAFNVRSLAQQQLGRYNEALADISKAIELKSDSAQYYANRGSILLDMKNDQAALGNLTKAISIDGNQGSFYNLRGIANRNLSNYDASIADYSRAIQSDGNNYQYYMNRGYAEDEAQRIVDARNDYTMASSLASTAEERNEAQTAINGLR